MFLKLTTLDNSATYINFDHVREFYPEDRNGKTCTVIIKTYGTELVHETASEIMAKLNA